MDEDKPQPEPRSPKKRWLKRILLGVVAFYLVYLIAGNVLLRTPWLQSQLSKKPALDIHWKSGVTYFPGLVNLEEFRIEGHQRMAHWDLSAAEVSGWIQLLALPFKSFSASGLKGQGISSNIHRVANPPPRKDKPPGWKVKLSNLELDKVEQVVFDHFKLAGEGKATGHVEFQVRGKVDFHQAKINFEDAELRQDGGIIGRAMGFTLDGGIATFKPGAQPPRELLNLTTARLDIDGQVASLGFLDVFLEKAPWLRLSGGGHLQGTWFVEKGMIGERSHLQLKDGDIQAQYLDSVVIGDAAMDLSASPKGLKIQADLTPFEIISIEGDPYIHGSGFSLTATSKNLQLGQPFHDLIADIVIPQSDIPDLTAYNAYLPQKTGVAVSQGKGRLDARFHFEAEGNHGNGQINLYGDSVIATVDNLPMAGTFHLKTNLRADDLLARKFELSGSELSLEDVYTGSKKASGKPWKGKIFLDKSTMVWQKPMAIKADLRMELQDSAPIVALMAQRKKIIAFAQDLLTVKDLNGTAHLRMEEEAVYMSPFQVDGEKLEVLGQLKFNNQVANGKMFIRFRGVKIGIALKDSKRNIKWTRARKWYAEHPELE